jgi:hypothetical protein
MSRFTLGIAIGVILVGLGWITGHAQRQDPDFEIRVDAPAGSTKIECVRGCELTWVERGVNPRAVPQPTFSFECGGGQTQRCSSFRVGGWITH